MANKSFAGVFKEAEGGIALHSLEMLGLISFYVERSGGVCVLPNTCSPLKSDQTAQERKQLKGPMLKGFLPPPLHEESGPCHYTLPKVSVVGGSRLG